MIIIILDKRILVSIKIKVVLCLQQKLLVSLTVCYLSFFFFFLRTLLKFCCETVMLEKMLCPNFILKIKVEMVYFIDEKNFKTKMVCFID